MVLLVAVVVAEVVNFPHRMGLLAEDCIVLVLVLSDLLLLRTTVDGLLVAAVPLVADLVMLRCLVLLPCPLWCESPPPLFVLL